MEFKRDAAHLIWMAIGTLLIVADFIMFLGQRWFIPIIIIGITTAWLPYWIDFFTENSRQKQYESEFLEFVRSLVGAIKSGMPAARAVIHVSTADYGALSPHIRKLANQLEWAIPFHKAFLTFGEETRNPVIKRAIITVIEAEQYGGNLEDVLQSITSSLIEIKQIKQKRKASIQGQMVQSYIIFFVFLGVMIIIKNMLIPYVTGGKGGMVSGLPFGSGSLGSSELSAMADKVQINYSSPTAFILTFAEWFMSLDGTFVMLSAIQGFFAGIVIGKMAEGEIRSGLKHSLILVTVSVFVLSITSG